MPVRSLARDITRAILYTKDLIFHPAFFNDAVFV